MLTLILILACVHKDSAIDTMPELKKNVLNFGYGANFKYEGVLWHSFERFYVVAMFEIPKMKHLKFTTFSFDLMCNYLNISNSYMQRYIKHCKRIAPYAKFYKKQIEYYNHTMMSYMIRISSALSHYMLNDSIQQQLTYHPMKSTPWQYEL